MTNVVFNEPPLAVRPAPPVRKPGMFESLVMRTGLAKTPQTAQKVLLALALVLIAIAIGLMVSGQSQPTVELEETESNPSLI